jgi:heme-degrading monooxygenase HmoA
MIWRVARFTLNDGVEPEFMNHTRRRVRDMVRDVDGLVDVRVARRMEGHQAVVVAMSRWRDFDSIRKFYGADIDKPNAWDPDGQWIAKADIEHMEDELELSKV